MLELQGWYVARDFYSEDSINQTQSCAATLSQHPDIFKVTIIERRKVCGGQATSIPLDKDKYGTDWLNDGVQGGSPVSGLLRFFPFTFTEKLSDLQAYHQFLSTVRT